MNEITVIAHMDGYVTDTSRVVSCTDDGGELRIGD